MGRMSLEKIKKLKRRDISNGLSYAWKKAYLLLLVFVWMALITWVGYIWYDALYSRNWSESQKSNLISSRFSERNLKKTVLEGVLENVKKRQEKFNLEIVPTKDIFQKY